MTPEEPLDDDMFINAKFLEKGPTQKAGVKTAPKGSVQPSPKALAQASGEVDHHGDSH